MSGLIYSNTSLANLNNFLNNQEEELSKLDKEKDDKKIIRIAIILGVSVLAIVVIKLIVKKKKND
jgi:uncharacterized membrane protein YoaK (UPF0700 family)